MSGFYENKYKFFPSEHPTYEKKSLDLPVADVCDDNSCESLMKNYERYIELTEAFEKANANIVIPEKTAESIEWFHELREKYEIIVSKFLDHFIRTNELIPYNPDVVNEVLEPFIPKCFYDEKKEVFEMEIDFVPYLKFKSIKDFSLVKNTLVYLIMEGIKRMKVKPNYNKKAVLIIFSLYSPFLFDLDNVEIKYIIDAMRYSHFFADDSCNYVSYMVEGKEEKTHPCMKVKVVKKNSVKIEDWQCRLA